MIVINTVDSTRFTYNGITYFKNFTPVVRGDKVEVINTYDSRLRLTDFATDYDQFSVNGTVYASVDLLQQALLPILFTRANLGGGTGTDAFIGLTDTPSSYVGKGGKVTKVNEAENGLEFVEEPTQLLNKPVENRYATLSAMLADQANQTTGFLNIVDDPDDEPNSGYYEKLNTSFGVIGDYQKLTADEIAVVENSNEWQIKNINAIQLSFASYVTLIQGRIFLETDNTNITFMIFDAAYTKILEKAVALSGSEDFYFNIYNKSRNTNIRPKWESSAYVDGGTKLRVAVSGFADSEVGVLETLHLGLPIAAAPVVDESKWEIVDATINNVGVGDLRVPTETEWDDERLSWGANNDVGAFGSPLKLPKAGSRDNINGGLGSVDLYGRYWSSTVSITNSSYLSFFIMSADIFTASRASGNSIRLILNNTFTQQQFNDNYSGQTIVIEGLTYGYVYNPTTSRIWLDRNLGATQVAISSTDANAYGWLYQWGRLTDGHQIRTSGTTATLSSTDVPVNGDFITTSASPNDWRSPQNDNLWQVGQKLIGKDTLKADYEDLLNKPTVIVQSVTGNSVDNTDPLNPVVNAIPLTGTEVGSPVTGEIEFDTNAGLKFGFTELINSTINLGQLGLYDADNGLEFGAIGNLNLELYDGQIIAPLFIIRNSLSSFQGVLSVPALTATRNYSLPDKSGTVALLEDLNNQVAVYNATVTGTFNFDLNTFDSFEGVLTGNTTVTVTNEPTVGKTFVKNINLTSTVDETITLPLSWNVYGTFVNDGTRNVLTINFANYTTAGLIVDCFINQPT